MIERKIESINSLEFAVVGINYHAAPISVREKFYFKETDKIDFMNILLDYGIGEQVILSTCNRSEIFFACEECAQSIDFIYDALEDFFELRDARQFFFHYEGRAALEHLFYVTIGLDSVAVGEDQILGQVIDAHQSALELGVTGKLMNKFFREAITFSKKLRSVTEISDLKTSIPYIGVNLLRDNMQLDGANALVVGVGKMGRLAIEYLLEYGAKVSVANRTEENSLILLKDFPEINIVRYGEYKRRINEFDVLVTATSSLHIIFTGEDAEHVDGEFKVLDLSVPRDVDERVRDRANITLFTVDELVLASNENTARKEMILRSYVSEVEEIVSDLLLWKQSARIDPIMESVNTRCEHISDDTIKFLFRKLSLSHSEKKLVEKLVRSALKKVMKEPLIALKNMEDSDKKEIAIEVLEDLFGEV